MENYSGNSIRAKREEASTEREHKVNQVVDSGAVVKQKTGFCKFFGDLINGDMKSLKEYLISDVLIPAVKSTLSDAISNGTDMLLYGESRGKRYSNQSSGPKVSYNSIYSRDSRNKVSYTESNGRASSVSDFEGILVDSMPEAQDVLAELYDVLDEYGIVSIADLYATAKIPTKIIDHEWGWYDLRDASIRRSGGKYLIKMPKPVSLNK